MSYSPRNYEFGIPQIEDERLEELASRITPLINRDGKLFHIEPVDLRRIAYTWDPKLTEEASPKEEIGTIRTLHSYGYHGFFKPSIAEVLAQIPEDLLDTVSSFTIDNASDPLANNAAVNAGFHEVDTILFKDAA